MIELITAIALLCQVAPSQNNVMEDVKRVDQYQLACQQYYVKCVGISEEIQNPLYPIGPCILKRKIK